MRTLTKLDLVAPEKISQHHEIWQTLARAIVQARRIRPDNFARGIAGTYITAALALEWLCSADAWLYLHQIKCGPVIQRTLVKIGYKQLFTKITEAAKESAEGRAWMAESVYTNLARLVREADVYFAAGPSVLVA